MRFDFDDVVIVIDRADPARLRLTVGNEFLLLDPDQVDALASALLGGGAYKGEQRRDGEKVKTCRRIANGDVVVTFWVPSPLGGSLLAERLIPLQTWLSYEPVSEAVSAPMEEAVHGAR